MIKIPQIVIFAGLCALGINAHAGTLNKGAWETGECGEKPIAPSLESRSVADFNESIAAMNAWKKEQVTYLDCLVKEANADIKKITETINAQQKEYKDFVEENNAEAEKIKQDIIDHNTLSGQ